MPNFILLPLILIAAYLGICLFVLIRQGTYMFVPARLITATPADAGLPFENLTLVTADGENLNAWFIPPPPGTVNPWTVVYCHGNAGNLSERVEPVHTLHQLGFAVCIFDYRGYGTSTGKPDEQGTYTDARAAWDYVTATRQTPASRVLIYGHSMGGAVAVWLAGQVHPGALVIDATFTSALDMGAAMFPYLPIRMLSRYQYNSLERIAHIRCPVFIAHGVNDITIPVTHGRRLFARAVEPKRYAEFVGDHASVGFDPETGYAAQLLAWLREIHPPSH
ncbi:MAG: alpha/beta fold hydrolase [Verrucomicrobia bacterium]|nr:alpha/beta fold hydrolase [Verrucomicrobiota bacterium]